MHYLYLLCLILLIHHVTSQRPITLDSNRYIEVKRKMQDFLVEHCSEPWRIFRECTRSNLKRCSQDAICVNNICCEPQTDEKFDIEKIRKHPLVTKNKKKSRE